MPNQAALEEKLVEMESANERVRLYYGSCSDLREKTPELAKIGFQPKRDAGEAQEQPEPGTPGPVTYDAATQTLSVAVKPANSTTIRAYRQPLGGVAELAGSSPTTTVSVVQFGPLTPGVTYDLWLVGHTQSAGEGP
jgi:hypothetical protein